MRCCEVLTDLTYGIKKSANIISKKLCNQGLWAFWCQHRPSSLFWLGVGFLAAVRWLVLISRLVWRSSGLFIFIGIALGLFAGLKKTKCSLIVDIAKKSWNSPSTSVQPIRIFLSKEEEEKICLSLLFSVFSVNTHLWTAFPTRALNPFRAATSRSSRRIQPRWRWHWMWPIRGWHHVLRRRHMVLLMKNNIDWLVLESCRCRGSCDWPAEILVRHSNTITERVEHTQQAVAAVNLPPDIQSE